VFQKGTRLRWTQTTVKYGTVINATHAAGTTTVTIAATPDYVLTAAAITVNSYSYIANPQGYPAYFNFTPTYGGFSTPPGAGALVFSIVGRLCTIVHALVTGTSNGTSFSFTIPVAPAVAVGSVSARCYNNGGFLAPSGLIDLTGGSTTANVYRDGTGTAWTASGAKTFAGFVTYPF
jgi:hypothetical protein